MIFARIMSLLVILIALYYAITGDSLLWALMMILSVLYSIEANTTKE